MRCLPCYNTPGNQQFQDMVNILDWRKIINFTEQNSKINYRGYSYVWWHCISTCLLHWNILDLCRQDGSYIEVFEINVASWVHSIIDCGEQNITWKYCVSEFFYKLLSQTKLLLSFHGENWSLSTFHWFIWQSTV